MSTCCDFTTPVQPSAGPLTLSWQSRVITNGGAQPTSNTLRALSVFETAMATILSKFYLINIIAPDSQIACLTPFVSAGTDPNTVVSFGTLTSAGYTAGGVANAVIHPGLNPSVVFPTIANGGWSIYFGALPVTGSGLSFGCNEASAGKYFMCNPCLPNFYAWCFDNGTTNLGGLGVGANPVTGFYALNRTSSTSLVAYHAATNYPFAPLGFSAALSNQTGPNREWLIAGTNNDGAVAADDASRVVNYVSVHDGLTSGECQTEFNAVQALRTALGGAA